RDHISADARLPQPSVTDVVVKRARTSLALHFPYDPALLDIVRELPGAEFDRRSKAWRIPYDEYALSELIERMPTARIDQDVLDWADDALLRRDRVIDAKQSNDAVLQYEFADKLRKYQRVAVDFLAKAGGGLLADEMGLGKTVEMIAALREMEIREGLLLPHYLIVCPNSMRNVWEREIRAWYPFDMPIHHVKGEVGDTPDYGFWI